MQQAPIRSILSDFDFFSKRMVALNKELFNDDPPLTVDQNAILFLAQEIRFLREELNARDKTE